MSDPAWKYMDESHRREALAALAEYDREQAEWKATKPPSGSVRLVQNLTTAIQQLLQASGLPSGGMDIRLQLPTEAFSLIEREVEWSTRHDGSVRPPSPDGVVIITALGMVHIREALP